MQLMLWAPGSSPRPAEGSPKGPPEAAIEEHVEQLLWVHLTLCAEICSQCCLHICSATAMHTFKMVCAGDTLAGRSSTPKCTGSQPGAASGCLALNLDIQRQVKSRTH